MKRVWNILAKERSQCNVSVASVTDNQTKEQQWRQVKFRDPSKTYICLWRSVKEQLKLSQFESAVAQNKRASKFTRRTLTYTPRLSLTFS
jgi:hypothetical protein